jgi:hypothetical protein
MTRLDEIEARLAAATPGPWWWRNTSEPYLQGARTRIVMAFRRMGTHAAQPQFRDSDGLLVDGGKANLNAFPDAALIAHAPADLAALLAVVKAVRTKAEGWAGMAPDDDWGEDIAQTIVADAGRAILATLDAALSGLEQP